VGRESISASRERGSPLDPETPDGHRIPVRRYILSVAVVACSVSLLPGQSGSRSGHWIELANALVERMALERGERVLLVGAAGRFDSLIGPLRRAVIDAGAIDLGAIGRQGEPLGSDMTPFVRGAKGLERAALVRYLGDVDLAVMLPGAVPIDPPYGAMQNVLRSGRGRTIHFHWAGAYDLAGQPLSITAEIDSLYRGAVLETDYASLAAHQGRLEAAMRAGEVRVTTPLGTDLHFRIGDRPVTRQDGDASAGRAAHARNLIDREIEIPAGAVRVAPLEESVVGVIAFPPSRWQGVEVTGLVLALDRGRVVSVEARSGLAAVESELEAAGEAGRRFREFALGLNPLLAVRSSGDSWIPYYGYGAGVVRLSLGDNTELGGNVAGGYVRWNFFVDATVTVGGETWVRQGQLVIPASSR